MKSSFCLFVVFFFSVEIYAQSDSLTMRDDLSLKYQIRKTLLPGYEKLLNFIAYPDNSPNEILDIINTKVNGSREQKLFTDSKVIIENDMLPGDDSNQPVRRDMEVSEYLSNYNISYSKSDDKTVVLTLVKISPLKYTSYFYYNLLFECNYSGKNSAGQSFRPINRIAEVKLVNDNGWHMYINSIRFATGSENDEANVFNNLIPADTNVVSIYDSYDNEEQQRLREQKKKMEQLTEEGRDLYALGDLSASLKKFHEARMVSPESAEPKEWVIKVRMELAKKKAEAEQKDHREQRIVFLKKEAIQQISKLNFPLAKVLADSLIYEYGVTDARISQMSNDLSLVNAAIESINNTRLKGKTEEAIILCQKKQLAVTDSFYRAHFFYLEADLLSADEKPPIKQVSEKLRYAIDLSGKKHQNALMMRSYLRMEKQKDAAGAIEDATLVVNNDPRNPEVYSFRARIFELDNDIPGAIADYSNAIANKTKDPLIYLKKSQHEYNQRKYTEAIRTATDGMEFSKCNGLLYFYRGLAEVYTYKLSEAGKDFWKAEKECGIGDNERKIVKALSDSCLNEGNVMSMNGQWTSAVREYSKSIAIDSNESALYQRAKCFISLGGIDSAIADLNKLCAKSTVFRNAFTLRGIAYSKISKFEKANNDFKNAVSRFPDDTMAYFHKGQSEIAQKNYKAALTSLEEAARLAPVDSTYYLLSLASFYDRNFDQAIKYSMKARNKHSTKFEVFYICGRAYYEKGDFKSALEEFAIAKANVSFDPGLWFSYAATLEAMQKYVEASREYDQLLSNGSYRDTANYRASICKIKSDVLMDYPRAIVQLDQYMHSLSENADKSTPYAWKAYAYLSLDSIAKSADAITEAKKYNDKDAMLQLVLACRSAKAQDWESACIFLERALASKQFTKEEIIAVSMLDDVKKKNKKYKILMQQYFP